MRISLVVLFISIVTAVGVEAQPTLQPPYERVLVPVVVAAATPGAYGSVWQTELVTRNEADQSVDISDNPFGLCNQCIPYAPHSTFRIPLYASNPNAGRFLYIGSPGVRNVTFTLRVQDISRQALTWGTTIPVVRDRDVFGGKLQLLDIPIDSRFRAALRVYDFEPPTEATPRVVRLRIYDMCGIGQIDTRCANTPLVDTSLTLVASGHESYPAFPQSPGTVFIGDLAGTFEQLANLPPVNLPDSTPRVRLDVDPVTPSLRFWAFVSVTNNETQHVTVISPQ
jgi:hypothetical protein